MDGGHTSIWVMKRLTLDQRYLLQKFEQFLMDYGKGYSFSHEYRKLEIKTRFERNQIKSHLGYIPEQEILVCS